MIITFVYDDKEHELVAIGDAPLGFDGPISAIYEPGEHGYHSIIERRLSPLGLLAVDIACAGLDGQVILRVTDSGAIVFSPASIDTTEQREIYNRLRGNFAQGVPVLEFKMECIFGKDVEELTISFVAKSFQGTAIGA